MTSRRKFLTQSLSAISFLLINEDLVKSRKKSGLLGYELLFSEEDIPRIKRNTKNPIFKKYWEMMVNADLKADKKFLTEELNLHDHVSHLARADNILRRSSFVSLIEENKEHEEIAKLAIEKILRFNEWDYFLEGGKEVIALNRAPDTTMVICSALDWMNTRLFKTDKEEMIKSISEKGIPPCYLTLYCLKNPDKVKGWTFNPTSSFKSKVDLSKWPVFLNETNLKMIPITGLIIGLAVLKDRNPESKKWLQTARESLGEFAQLYGKDGCYPEGLGYWAYTSLFLIIAVDVLQRNFKLKYDDLINFEGTSRFLLNMLSPFKSYPGATINFGDCAFSPEKSPALWVAKEFKDGIAQYAGTTNIDQLNIYSLIWHDDRIKPLEPSSEKIDVRISNDWIISRSGFTENDTVLGFRSGGPANHEHADRNSIILNACGERFFHDPLGAAYSNKDKHWLLRLTEAHTAVLIDGKGHQYHDGSEGTNSSKASAKITQYISGNNFTVVSSDATQAYQLINTDIKKVQRTVALVKPDILIIVDEMEKNEIPSKFQARYQAFNVDGKALLRALPETKTFQIHRPYGKLLANIKSNVNIGITENKLDIPVEKGIFPFIEVSADSSQKCTMITACTMIPNSENQNPEINISNEGKDYKVRIKFSIKEINLFISMNDDYPIIKL